MLTKTKKRAAPWVITEELLSRQAERVERATHVLVSWGCVQGARCRRQAGSIQGASSACTRRAAREASNCRGSPASGRQAGLRRQRKLDGKDAAFIGQLASAHLAADRLDGLTADRESDAEVGSIAAAPLAERAE